MTRPLRIEPLDGFGPVYGPPGRAPAPGVVIVHGSEGPMAGWSHRFAAILAAHGVRALALSYGEGDFWGAGPIRQVPLELLVDAVAALDATPDVTRAGIFGWSKGAEMTLLAATLADPAPACVAVHAAPDRVTGAFDPEAMRAGGAWRRDDPDAPSAWTWRGRADGPLTPGSPIEIERYAGPVFLSVGLADEIWAPEQTLRLAERLDRAGNPADLMALEGQGHAYDFATEPVLWDRLTAFLHRHLGARA